MERTDGPGPALRQGKRILRVLPGAAAVAAAIVLLAGCTPEPPPDGNVTTTPAAVPTEPAVSPTPQPTPPETADIEFAFQPPESPCVPISALDALPPSPEHPYVAVNPFLEERDDQITTFCTYERADIGDGDDMVLEDHVVVTSQLTLYHEWGDSHWAGLYEELPVASADLDDWATGIAYSRDRGIWWEGCGPATPCGEDEEPTVRTRAWRSRFQGHVGNLEFYVGVVYVARILPHDAEMRTVEVFRDLVLAHLDNWQQLDQAD